MQAVVGLVSRAFQLGLVLSMPSIVVYLLFYVIQAILARTSPQFNLFSVGFAITVPLAFLVLMILLPDLPRFLVRALEAPFGLVRQGLLP
jgi:flagellar biosynthetic protein FliR